MTPKITFTGISIAADYMRRVPAVTSMAARLAVNQVADRQALPLIKQHMQAEVAFPKGYLNEDRIGVTQRATNASLEATITGRHRATSLARFAPGQTPQSTRNNGVRVMVKPGQSQYLKKSWLVKLPAGSGDNLNMGLAVRLKPGEVFANKHTLAGRLASNVFLLYGPSVDQVFRGVTDEASPEIGDMVGLEFLRQFTRLMDE